MLRRCARCKIEKPLAEYTKHPLRDGRIKTDSYCPACRADYGREHYVKNRQRYIDKAAQRTRQLVIERMTYVVEHLSQHPCADCGEDDVLVLEFDHLRDKSFSIPWGIRNRPWALVLAEIEKCEVVCANCHRRRTIRRAGFARAAIARKDPQLALFLTQSQLDPHPEREAY